MSEQRCNKCGDRKPLDAFIKHSYYKTGRGRTCKPCASTASQERKERNREAVNARRREAYRKSEEAKRRTRAQLERRLADAEELVAYLRDRLAAL